ncbi:hypothetical protein ACFQ4K_01980 [Tistrella bauzanensis]
MLTIATDDQLLIGQFAAPLAEGPIRQGRIYRMVDTPASSATPRACWTGSRARRWAVPP